jgi:uncharacterized protein with HEPN domain
VIGEAANQIGEDVQAKAPEISWAEVVALRNLIAHEYFRVDLDVIQEIVAESLAPLDSAARRLLAEM